MALSTAE
jgi:hypothetical protein